MARKWSKTGLKWPKRSHAGNSLKQVETDWKEPETKKSKNKLDYARPGKNVHAQNKSGSNRRFGVFSVHIWPYLGHSGIVFGIVLGSFWAITGAIFRGVFTVILRFWGEFILEVQWKRMEIMQDKIYANFCQISVKQWENVQTHALFVYKTFVFLKNRLKSTSQQ